MACADYPHDVIKNRVLSFAANNDIPVSFQVELTEVGPSECYVNDPSGDVGTTWWVTRPICTDRNGNDTGAIPGVHPCPEPNIWRSQLTTDPSLAGPFLWPEECTHIVDCEVIPLATYEMTCSLGPDDDHFTWPAEPLNTQARPGSKCWGDCVGLWNDVQWTPPNGVVSFDDIMAAVLRFKDAPNAPHRMWVEMADEGPDMVLNFTDVLFLVKAFKGNPYPFSCPGDCP